MSELFGVTPLFLLIECFTSLLSLAYTITTEYLFYGSTMFSGTPTALPPNLIEFDNSYTFTKGSFDGFAHGSALEYIVLDGNSYDSDIPISFSNLQLKMFHLSNTDITGDLSFLIPGAAMGKFDMLEEFWVENNPSLGGSIPPEISLLLSLTSLKLAGNSLSGTLPADIGNMSWLVEVFLQNNQSMAPFHPNMVKCLSYKGSASKGT